MGIGPMFILKTGGGLKAYSLGTDICLAGGRYRELGLAGDCSFFYMERERLALTVARVLLIIDMKP